MISVSHLIKEILGLSVRSECRPFNRTPSRRAGWLSDVPTFFLPVKLEASILTGIWNSEAREEKLGRRHPLPSARPAHFRPQLTLDLPRTCRSVSVSSPAAKIQHPVCDSVGRLDLLVRVCHNRLCTYRIKLPRFQESNTVGI